MAVTNDPISQGAIAQKFGLIGGEGREADVPFNPAGTTPTKKGLLTVEANSVVVQIPQGSGIIVGTQTDTPDKDPSISPWSEGPVFYNKIRHPIRTFKRWLGGEKTSFMSYYNDGLKELASVSLSTKYNLLAFDMTKVPSGGLVTKRCSFMLVSVDRDGTVPDISFQFRPFGNYFFGGDYVRRQFIEASHGIVAIGAIGRASILHIPKGESREVQSQKWLTYSNNLSTGGYYSLWPRSLWNRYAHGIKNYGVTLTNNSDQDAFVVLQTPVPVDTPVQQDPAEKPVSAKKKGLIARMLFR